ncbi:MAG: hypothetical protein HAW66_05000 [Shewanella sp.]|nr:hypothetical protein [Shewanella sp.]
MVPASIINSDFTKLWAQNYPVHAVIEGAATGPIGLGTAAGTSLVQTGCQYAYRHACTKLLPDNNVVKYLAWGAEAALIGGTCGVTSIIAKTGHWAIALSSAVLGSLGSNVAENEYEQYLVRSHTPENSKWRSVGKPITKAVSGGLITLGTNKLLSYLFTSKGAQEATAPSKVTQIRKRDAPTITTTEVAKNCTTPFTLSGGSCINPVAISAYVGLWVGLGLLIGCCFCGIKIKRRCEAKDVVDRLLEQGRANGLELDPETIILNILTDNEDRSQQRLSVESSPVTLESVIEQFIVECKILGHEYTPEHVIETLRIHPDDGKAMLLKGELPESDSEEPKQIGNGDNISEDLPPYS